MSSVLGNSSEGGVSTIFLPSNAKCDYFENKTSHFVTDLAEPINLKPGAKIALAEIIYPNSIMNVFEPMTEIHLLKKRGIKTGHYNKTILGKNYRNIEQLIRVINGAIKSAKMESTLRVNNKTGLCEIIVESEETIKVHRKLANILGFIDKVEFANVGNTPSLPRAYAGDVVPDINLLTFSLYIYSDIVYPTRVGNTIVPILGIIHCDSRLDSQYTHRTLPILNYIPVIGNVLSKIELKITDTTGDLIHFQFGKVIIRLSLFQPD